MYYLGYYKEKEHLDVNHFDSLVKIKEHVKSCTNWADNFAIFADQWSTYKVVGVVKPDGSILWTGSAGRITEPACKFLNNIS